MRRRLRGFQCRYGGREKYLPLLGIELSQSIPWPVILQAGVRLIWPEGIPLLNLNALYNFLLELIILTLSTRWYQVPQFNEYVA
jgi:hypothetical protein